MENFYKYAGINKTVSLILYALWFFSQADGESILALAGSTVNLRCNVDSTSTLKQLEWKMNGDQLLISFVPDQPPYVTPKAQSLRVNMSVSESQLIFETVQSFHTGNYTCSTTTATGVWEQTWELRTTADHVKVPRRALLWSDTPDERRAVFSPSILSSLVLYLFAFLLCGIILVVCLCRKRESSEDLTLSYVEYQVKYGEEEVSPSALGQICVEYSVTESTLEETQFSVFPSMHDVRIKND